MGGVDGVEVADLEEFTAALALVKREEADLGVGYGGWDGLARGAFGSRRFRFVEGGGKLRAKVIGDRRG